MYLFQKLEIPGNAINPGNERYKRKKIRLKFIFIFVPIHFQENLGTICPSRVLISIFGRKSFSYPATLTHFTISQLLNRKISEEQEKVDMNLRLFAMTSCEHTAFIPRALISQVSY